MLQVELTVRLPRPQAGDAAVLKAHEDFSKALDDGLRSLGLGPLRSWSGRLDSLAAVIEPPERIGEALWLARTLLKCHRLKLGAVVSFDKVLCDGIA